VYHPAKRRAQRKGQVGSEKALNSARIGENKVALSKKKRKDVQASSKLRKVCDPCQPGPPKQSLSRIERGEGGVSLQKGSHRSVPPSRSRIGGRKRHHRPIGEREG